MKSIPGLKSVQRVVCGGCLDYKVVVALAEPSFGAWAEKKFEPEARKRPQTAPQEVRTAAHGTRGQPVCRRSFWRQ